MSNLCGSVVALGLSIASAIILAFVITQSASDRLTALKQEADIAQLRLNSLASRVSTLVACHTQTNGKKGDDIHTHIPNRV